MPLAWLCYNLHIQKTEGANPMDMNALAKMIEWLDEERRRDKQTITTLEERLAQQAETMLMLQRRVGGMESDQSVLKQQSMPIQREADLIDQVRQEMRTLLENSEARRLTAEREAERLRNLDREGIMRTLGQINDQLDKVQRTANTLPDVKNEGSRVADMVSALQLRIDDVFKKLEEPERRLALIEEQRRQDLRRLSQIESDYQELKKQLDTARTKLPLIEDLAIRNERRIQEIQNGEVQRREQIQQFIDSQNLLIHQRDQEIANLLKRFNDQDGEMAKNIERFEAWSQTHREMRRIIDDFERIGDRLERRIGEVAEIQRLSEERFRTEWNNYKDDEQKKWKQINLTSDEIWRGHDREFEAYVKRLGEIETSLPTVLDNVKRLWSLERERAQMYRERYQTLLLEYDTGSSLNLTNGNGYGGGTSE
jgi:chromosome segregation ATPase